MTSTILSLLIIFSSSNLRPAPVQAASQVFIDFVATAQAASWASGAGSLPFPGSESDNRGFACYKIGPVMEDDTIPARVLETHPEWVAGGWISGTYPQLTIPDYAELDIGFGFIKGATGSDGVIFEVLFQEGQTRHTLLSRTATYNGKLDSIALNLNDLTGKTGRFIIYVNAGKSSGQDWACWTEARIMVTPPPPPTTTQTPPTTTQAPPATTQTPPATTTVPPTTLPPQTTTDAPPTTTKPQPTETPAPPTTTEPAATEPLRITSGPAVSEITRNSAVISWQTSRSANSTVDWGTLAGKLEYETGKNEAVITHSISLENLAEGTSYAFQAHSADIDGNSASSKLFHFTTGTGSDNEKPRASINLPEVMAGKALIRVEADDNRQVDRVVFYLDGLPAFTDYSLPFEWPCDTSELDEGSHSFAARAYDSSGNYTEEITNGDLDQRFEQQLSPMKVKIHSPQEGDGLCLILNMHYEISNDYGFKWKSMRTRIDGEIISEYTYTHPISLPKSSRVFYDDLELTFGEHVLEFSAEDEYGNWGTDTVRFNWLQPPSLAVTRDVTRIDNYFQVTLSLANSGEADAQNVVVTDTSLGYQYAEGVYSTLISPVHSGLITAGTVSNDPVNCWQSTLEFNLNTISPGETVSVRYYVIPVLVDPPGLLLFPCIGSELVVDYRYSAGLSSAATYSERYLNGWSDSEERRAALAAADYLMLTCPASLFSVFSFYPDDVNHLLATAARLARYQGAVFGYTSRSRVATGGWGVKSIIRSGSSWARSLCPGWAEGNGYLLIIGEMGIIPAFDVPNLHQVDRAAVVHDTDYPYADTWGEDNIPELRVGRIIGKNPADMAIPLDSSLDVLARNYEFNRYGGQALLVSGPELGEGFCGITGRAGSVLESQGIDTEFVAGEYFTEEIELLREALVLRGDYGCIEESGHRTWEGVLCTKTHPSMELAELRALISIEEAINVHHDHGYPSDYTIYDTMCLAGAARGSEVKAGARDKDIIIWVGHGGPDVWGWVIEDKLGGCGSTDLYIGGDADVSITPIDFGSKRPVVLAASCLTGAYARLTGRSIAQAFLRLGAGVYIGNVEVQGLGAVEEVAVKFYRDYWIGATLSAGDALKNMKDDLARYRYATRSWDIYEMNLYGDPKFGGS
ncbi:MAG: hypothetical protein JW954_02385 [Dehalococcoidaceae bacterium]|nr:hypothetical protein [Dehalococcoidaceae bacterium]